MMRKGFLPVVAFILLMPMVALGGGIHRVVATGYHSNGDLISGWHWIRRPGAYSQWSFPALPPHGISAICVSALSTNHTDGGAGYDSRVLVGIKVDGKPVRWLRRPLVLKNACPCIKYPGYSHGIGYRSYGCRRIKLPANTPFSILLKYPGKGHHTATRKDSVKVIYITP
jgi:hypothetical protein